jgi:hypothetical protein
LALSRSTGRLGSSQQRCGHDLDRGLNMIQLF